MLNMLVALVYLKEKTIEG
eukprot:gene19894-25849_t